MNTYFNNLLKLPGLYITLKNNLKLQKKFIKKTIALDIKESRFTNDGSLSDKDYNKITGYYGLAVPAVLGESFCILRGKKMTEKERLSLTYLGGLTGLFDDFFDEKDMSEEHILNLINTPEDPIIKSAHEKLFTTFYKKALENAADVNLVKDYFIKVFDAQVLSKKQILPEIDYDEINSITFQKGGISLLFYRCALSQAMNEEEEKLLYKLGGLMQLENDIFDIYKDHKAGIKTLVTTETKIENLKKIYKYLIDEIHELVFNYNYPIKNKKKFLRIISMIICRGNVCLDMLQKKEELTNNVFAIDKYERKDLICDMEKPVNILKTINYYGKSNV